MMDKKKKLIIGISGASGAFLGMETLKALRRTGRVETHLVFSNTVEKTLQLETSQNLEDLKSMADEVYPNMDLSARIASGSFFTDGMIVVPCSMKTLAGIASGYSDNLLLRAVDVCMKERRKVVLVPRETPLNGIHLRNMATADQYGCVILPAMMTFYHRPQSIQEMTDQLIGKILLQFGIEYDRFTPWEGE